MTTDPDADLTRKQRRDQARAERKSSEQAAAARAGARRQRLIQLGAVVGLAVVIVAAILIATGGGSKKKVVAKPTSPQAVQAIATVRSLLDGIPQKGNVLGNPNAPVTLVYFGDLECPICRDFTTGALPSVIKTYVRSGKLKIEYLSLETATHEKETFKTQQVAAYAAGKQNLAWYFIELFYHEQGEEGTGYVNESYLQGLAQQVPGLNLPTWTSDRNDTALAKQIKGDEKAAASNEFTGTPSFLIGKTGGTLQKLEAPSFTEPAPYLTAVAQVLKS